MGQQLVWSSALGEDYQSAIPRLVEEPTELVGYGLLLVACLDFMPNSERVQGMLEDADDSPTRVHQEPVAHS